MIRITVFLLLAELGVYAQGQLACPTSPSSQAGPDFHGQNLAGRSFSRQDLTNANFQGATLTGVYFGGANLTGANFSGAIITNDPSNPTLVANFSFANLDSACFIGAKFTGRTYFTYANVACADFSQTDINNGNVIFGNSLNLLIEIGRNCRTVFRSTTMNCEFVGNWGLLDLSGAKINACYSQLAGRDFTGAKMASVDFTEAILDRTKFVQADLSQATFTRASLQGADFSYATLFDAQLDHVNLTGATLYHAFLANNVGGKISNSASVQYSHLKNVNLSFAELSGVHFTYTNFYGDSATPSGSCTTSGANYEGFTCGCAAAHGANMVDTYFDDGYLFGVDFTGAKVQGVSFFQAVLVGANFSGATISTGSNGNASAFTRAFLQGANLAAATSPANADLTDAFLDFRGGGNNIYIFLAGGDHNDFTCPTSSSCAPASGQDVCVEVNYPTATTVPADTSSITCPGGGNNCGGADPSGSNTKWKSTVADIGMPSSGPPAWYDQDATYTKAPTSQSIICKGQGTNNVIVLW